MTKIIFNRFAPLIFCCAAMFWSACQCSKKDKNAAISTEWKSKLKEEMPFLGHRNWILVVDKAFPLQQSEGMEYIYAGGDIATVLKQVLQMIDTSGHVTPQVFRDVEFNFVVPQIGQPAKQLDHTINALLAKREVKTLPHDSVFKKLDTESKLFKVLVIKTDQLIPYSSVFIRLDCGYWNAGKEAELRKAIAKGQNQSN